MTNKCHKDSDTASNISQKDEKNSKDYEIVDDSREEIEDGRRFEFAMIDYKFIEAGFDAHTVSLYLRIVMRADNHKRGCFENKSTVAKKAGISASTQKRCRALLEYCNVIKITQRRHPENPKIMISSKIELIDKSKWNLDHEYRDAWEFSQKEDTSVRDEPTPHVVTNPPPVRDEPDNKTNINKTKKNKTISKEKNQKRENCKGAGISLVKYIQSRISSEFINYAEGEIFVEQVLKEAGVNLKKYTEEFMKFKEFMEDKPYLLNAIIDIKHFKVLLIQWVQDRPAIIRKFHCEGSIG